MYPCGYYQPQYCAPTYQRTGCGLGLILVLFILLILLGCGATQCQSCQG